MAQTWISEYRAYEGIVIEPSIMKEEKGWYYLVHMFIKKSGSLGPYELLPSHILVGTLPTEEEATLACNAVVRREIERTGGKVW